MDESQYFGMEAEAVDRRGFIAVTVFAVAYHRAPFGRQMYADLVGTACLQVPFDEGISNPSRPPIKGGEVSAAGFPP